MRLGITGRLTKEEQEQIAKECIENFNAYQNRWPDPRVFAPNTMQSVEWEGEGSVVRDITGRELLDFLGGYGIFTLGHRHPKVVAAVKAQLDRLALHSQKLMNPAAADAARRLAEIAPGNLRKVFFCNSGTEAVEGALKLARLYTKRTHVVAAINSFHGKTLGALSVTGRELFRKPVGDLLPASFVPYGDAKALESAVQADTAAVILEPVQGEGGVHVPPTDYWPSVREICTRRGVLLIADEVQTGLGRTGRMFGVDHYGIVPDIISMGKALSGGIIPCAAFISTDEIWRAFHALPLIHTSTFGSNPLACAAAAAAIEVTVEEDLPRQAKATGDYLMTRLRDLQSRHAAIIREVRGQGLLIGLEIADEALGVRLADALFDRGVLVAHTLNRPEVIRIEPPLNVPRPLVDIFLACLADSLAGDLLP
ncbi:MAG: aminotransferase class III-fold pyridoxal phosphate-dependent enzyme [Acidobacteria bacterium]|nr:aminotransferase class III-fold pyridoxal phosphate-dependent enzyme [Acidobacteriota bacterium]MBI3655258.1 aminotransferase class III-fold pyridoxal phosphate-dependent enzyme [Acidobacteriota bacterium]